jgi:tetratricopeptide (TPR) repeat protein
MRAPASPLHPVPTPQVEASFDGSSVHPIEHVQPPSSPSSEARDGAVRAAEARAAYEIRLGDAYMNIGEYEKAIGSFSTAIALTPDNREAQEKVRRARRAQTAEETVLQ